MLIKLPTATRSLNALLGALPSALLGGRLPYGCHAQRVNGELQLSLGRTVLHLRPEYEADLTALSRRALGARCRAAALALGGLIAAACDDRASLGLGRSYYARGGCGSTRLARALGLSPDSATLHRLDSAVELLGNVAYSTRVGRVPYGPHVLITLEDDPVQLATGAAPEGCRGGSWRVARVAPSLHALTHRAYLRLPLTALRHGPRVYLASVAILAERALRRSTPDLAVDERRLHRDAQLEQTQRRGLARAQALLGRALDRLWGLGLDLLLERHAARPGGRSTATLRLVPVVAPLPAGAPPGASGEAPRGP